MDDERKEYLLKKWSAVLNNTLSSSPKTILIEPQETWNFEKDYKNNMSMFDDRQFLFGLPVRGQKIKYVHPTKFAFHTNVIEDEKNLLEIGKEYTVRKVNLNSSSTYVFLEEFWDEGLDEYRFNQKFFNMYAFDWQMPEINLDLLIGRDPRDTSHLHRSYKIGITENGKVHYDGDPMLCVEYEMFLSGLSKDCRRNLKITKAYWK